MTERDKWFRFLRLWAALAGAWAVVAVIRWPWRETLLVGLCMAIVVVMVLCTIMVVETLDRRRGG